MKAVARVGRRCINIAYCINMVEALDWMQPWKPGGKKAERGRRSAPLSPLLQIGFPLKEQRHPTTSPMQNKTKHARRAPGASRSRPNSFLSFSYFIKHADKGDGSSTLLPYYQSSHYYKCTIICKVISHGAGGHSSRGDLLRVQCSAPLLNLTPHDSH